MDTGDDRGATSLRLQGWIEASRAAALDVPRDVVRGGDPAGGLAAFATLRNASIVSRRHHDTDGNRHLASTARKLICRGASPVLVVRARQPEASTARTRHSRCALAAASPRP